MTSFAGPNALAVNQTDAARQEAALARATDWIRDATGQLITAGTSAERHTGTGRRLLQVRQVPVVAVTSVTVDGLPWVEGTDYDVDLETGVLTRPCGYGWPRGRTIVVDYSHGYEQVPEDLARLCAHLADRILDGTAGDVASFSERIGDRSVQIQWDTAGVFDAEGCRTLDRYRQTKLP